MMKIYMNKFTRNILIGLTVTTLTVSSYSEAHAFNNENNLKNSSKNIVLEINSLLQFDEFINSISEEVSVVKNNYIPDSHFVFPGKITYGSPFYRSLKVLSYLSNYSYLNNTSLEDDLRNEKTISTYALSDNNAIDLDLMDVESFLIDFAFYNQSVFSKIDYDDEELISSRRLDISELNSLINPSLFLINDNDKKNIDVQFNLLIDLIKFCYSKDTNHIKSTLFSYFEHQKNMDVSESVKWLNNVTNNAMCIKILETFLVQNYKKEQLEQIFNDLSSANLYFISDNYDKSSISDINFDNINDEFLKLILEIDKKLHINCYCNTHEFLLNEVKNKLSKNNSKIK